MDSAMKDSYALYYPQLFLNVPVFNPKYLQMVAPIICVLRVNTEGVLKLMYVARENVVAAHFITILVNNHYILTSRMWYCTDHPSRFFSANTEPCISTGTDVAPITFSSVTATLCISCVSFL